MSLPPELIGQLIGQATAQQALDIDQRLNECLEILRPHFPQVALTKPRLEYELKGTVAGRAAGGRLIKVNLKLLVENYDHYLKQTLAHELAHCVAYQVWGKNGYTQSFKHHGRQWAYVMNLLGLPALRCHQYEVTPQRKHKKPHKYACGCGRPHNLTNYKHNKILAGAEYVCGSCRGTLWFVSTDNGS